MEVVKQRRQVSLSRSSMRILIDAYHEEGFRKVKRFGIAVFVAVHKCLNFRVYIGDMDPL